MVRTHWILNNNMAVMADSPTDFPLEEEDLHLNFIFDSFIFYSYYNYCSLLLIIYDFEHNFKNHYHAEIPEMHVSITVLWIPFAINFHKYNH